MRYLGASAACLVAAMTFSLTPHGQTARAAEGEPAAGSLIGTNSILPLAATTLTFNIARYGGTSKTPTLLQAYTEYRRPPDCRPKSIGEWNPPAATINKATEFCDKNTTKPTMKCGTVTFGKVTGKLGNGDCPTHTYTFAAIYYEWTAHNNQDDAPGPPNTVSDSFNATWSTPDGKFSFPFTFDIHVPVVRPDHEMTAFASWSPVQPTYGRWHQTLIPPTSSDPTFDFTGETVQEFPPSGSPATCTKPATCPDKCWFPGSTRKPFIMITGGTWIIGQVYTGGSSGCEGTPASAEKNTWGYDCVGQHSSNVTYYRAQSPTLKKTGSCGTTFGQEMEINAPSDSTGSYTPYGKTNTGNVNTLGASETLTTVTSTRAGMTTPPHKWP